jgi:CMP-N,N'-diacetyllegionaminic acid synthase
MLKNKKICCIIPARSGSKQIKNKNFKKIDGKALFLHSIEQAKKSKYIDEVYFNSDSKKMIKLAKLAGAKCDFVRPPKLSKDKSMIADVIIHHFDFYKIKQKYEYFLLLEPTSPLTSTKDIDESIKIILNNKKATSLVSISSHTIPNINMQVLKKNKFLLTNKNKSIYKTRRQDFKKKYFLCGTLYISLIDTFLKYKNFIQKNTTYYEVSKIKTFEIDDLIDLKIVEALFKIRKKNEKN